MLINLYNYLSCLLYQVVTTGHPEKSSSNVVTHQQALDTLSLMVDN